MGDLAVLLTAADRGGFMRRSKWKWPVTFPVVLDELSNRKTAERSDSQPLCFLSPPTEFYFWNVETNKGLSSGKGLGVFTKLWHFSFSFPFFSLSTKNASGAPFRSAVRHLLNTHRCCWSRSSDSQAVCDLLVAEWEEPSEASGQHKAALTRKSTFKRPLNPCTFRKSPAFNFTQFCN